jgi:hypothetical protein
MNKRTSSPDLMALGFDKERELQRYIATALTMQGYDVKIEVPVIEGLRADIVTTNTVVEVKFRLTRESLFAAVGQAVTYQHYLRKRQVVIIGCQVDCAETIKYFRAIQPVVKTIHLQARHLRSLRDYVNGAKSGFNFRGLPITEIEVARASNVIRKLVKRIEH